MRSSGLRWSIFADVPPLHLRICASVHVLCRLSRRFSSITPTFSSTRVKSSRRRPSLTRPNSAPTAAASLSASNSVLPYALQLILMHRLCVYPQYLLYRLQTIFPYYHMPPSFPPSDLSPSHSRPCPSGMRHLGPGAGSAPVQRLYTLDTRRRLYSQFYLIGSGPRNIFTRWNLIQWWFRSLPPYRLPVLPRVALVPSSSVVPERTRAGALGVLLHVVIKHRGGPEP